MLKAPKRVPKGHKFLGGSGAYSPREFFKFAHSQMQFCAISGISSDKISHMELLVKLTLHGRDTKIYYTFFCAVAAFSKLAGQWLNEPPPQKA